MAIFLVRIPLAFAEVGTIPLASPIALIKLNPFSWNLDSTGFGKLAHYRDFMIGYITDFDCITITNYTLLREYPAFCSDLKPKL